VDVNGVLERRLTTVAGERGFSGGPIVILTGPGGSGKTTACLQLVAWARQRGLECAGIACPGRLERSRKVGIDVVNVRTDERRFLAAVDNLPGQLRLGPYRFDGCALIWGAACLGAACPCDVLIVDEIGPLEVERREGWANAIEVLRTGRYRLAVAVVRPSLVGAVRTAIGARLSVIRRLPFDIPGHGESSELPAMLQEDAAAILSSKRQGTFPAPVSEDLAGKDGRGSC
jgi:nucleoside-triphosphatase THEP1